MSVIFAHKEIKVVVLLKLINFIPHKLTTTETENRRKNLQAHELQTYHEY